MSDVTKSTNTKNKTKDYQTKSWVFTWNNYENTSNYESILENFAKKYCEYMCYSHEIAPTTKTKHLQGYFNLLNKSRLQTLKNRTVKEIHFERAKKCKLANYRYVTKEGNAWIYDSTTNFMGIVEKDYFKKNKISFNKYTICIDLARQDKWDEIIKKFPETYLKYKKQLQEFKLDSTKAKRMMLNNEFGNFFHEHFLWLYGPTGCGKSYFCHILPIILNEFYRILCARTKMEYTELKVYYKNKNKWWDRYNGEQIIIIEEANPENMKISASYYKQWIDEYPFNPEIKGATINYIRPEFIIITSNYSLKQCFTDEQTNKIRSEDYYPLERRLKQIHLTEKSDVQWPNFHNLTKYEITKNYVKENLNNNIQDLIDKLNLTNTIENVVNLTIPTKRNLEDQSTSNTPNKKIKGKEPINENSENSN